MVDAVPEAAPSVATVEAYPVLPELPGCSLAPRDHHSELHPSAGSGASRSKRPLVGGVLSMP
jgi:hypothetical protein